MKGYIINLYIRLASLVFAVGLLAACSEELPLSKQEGEPQIAQDALAITPSLFSLGDNQITRTRAVGDEVPGDDTYRENYIRRIDVFILQDDAVLQSYSQVSDEGFVNKEPVVLANNWKAENLVPGNTYDVYVLVNNPNMETGAKPKNRSELMELKTTDPNIHKLYKEGADQESDIFHSGKTFMMDGFVDDWSPVANAISQNIPVTLKRAAAKVVATFEFSQNMEAVDADGDAIFVKTGTDENNYKESENWVYSNTTQAGVVYYKDKEKTQELAASQVKEQDGEKVRARMTFEQFLQQQGHQLGTGSPMWKFVNFNHTTRDIASASLPKPDLKVADEILGLEKSDTWAIQTYTYEHDWKETENAEREAPYLLVSIPILLNGEEDVTYHYYRLPIVDESKLTKTERNTIYYSKSTIESLGATSLDDLLNPVDLSFEVLPWTDEKSEITNVISEHLFFLLVQPVNVEMRGTLASESYNQTTLDYYAPNGNTVKIDASSLNISYLNSEKERAYLVKDGKLQTITNNKFSSTTTTYDDRQTINVTFGGTVASNTSVSNKTNITIDGNGNINITSDVLYNQAIKTISFRVYLEGYESTLYQDIVIQHYPVDNIQSFEGWWSSKYTSYTTGKKTVREYTYSLAEAQSWGINTDNQYEKEKTTENLCDPSLTEPLTFNGTPSSNGGYEEGPTPISSSDFRSAIKDSDNRKKANGEQNAIESGGYYYWGLDPEYTRNNDYDYTDRWNYKYKFYYRAKYKPTTAINYYRKKWYREIETDVLQITSNWAFLNETTNGGTIHLNGSTARVYNNGIYDMGYNQNTKMGYASNSDTYSSGLKNNHMYVIQITSASDKYVIGRPTIDPNTKQSKDNVVYPALMMASQLGAVHSGTNYGGQNNVAYNATNAAKHCSEYMEVDVNGKKFLGWRLPTDTEIKVIYNYQYQTKAQDVIVEVLSGDYYYNLSGGKTRNEDKTGNTTAVRCVRELTEDDLNYLRYLNGETVPGFNLTHYLNN